MQNDIAEKSAPSVVLEIDDVWATYDGVMSILQGVTLSLHKGKIFALLGGNGAGKSTTLKAVAGLLNVTAGKIMFGGEDISKLRPHQIVARGISFAMQGKDVFPSMSVDQNLRLGAFSRSDKTEINADAIKLYDMFPSLKARRHQPAAILSGGERQMLVMARGLMARPQILLIDEPSAALAPRVVDEVMQTISNLRDQGLSILLVEQNVNAALDIADHFFVLREGRIVADGDASERGRFEEIKKIYFGVVMGDAPSSGMALA